MRALLLFIHVAVAAGGLSTTLSTALKPAADLAAPLARGETVPDLGAACGKISAGAAKALDALPADEREAIERAVDARLETLYRRQAGLLRAEAAAALAAAPAAADAFRLRCEKSAEFEAACAAAKPPTADWDAAVEGEALLELADALATGRRGAADAQLAAAESQAHFLGLYQALQSEVQQLQQLQYQRPPPLSVGFAARVPDTEINVSGGYQQGRGTFQVTAVDDETRMEGDPAVITAPTQGNLGFSVVL